MNDIELREEQPESVTILVDQPATIDPHESEREKAFDAVHEWKGQPLQPFSSGRRREWIRLRGLDGKDPSFIDDAVKIVWLCLTPTDELITKRRNPEAMSAEIWKWADSNIGSNENEAVLELADRILIDSESNRAIPVPSNNQQPGN